MKLYYPLLGGVGVGNTYANMKRKIIPYKPNLRALAKKLRQNMTYSEVKMWNKLKTGRMMDYDFDRQRPVGNYIVDFFSKDLLLVIEIDGMTHEDESAVIKDELRQKELESMGINFLRFSALKVVHDMPNVLRAIEFWIEDYEEQFGIPKNVQKKRMVE